MKQMMPGAPSSWLAYVEVADVPASTRKAKSLGAQVMVDNKEIEGAGWMSIIVDPTGGVLGLWKSKPAPKRAPKRARKDSGMNTRCYSPRTEWRGGLRFPCRWWHVLRNFRGL